MAQSEGSQASRLPCPDLAVPAISIKNIQPGSPLPKGVAHKAGEASLQYDHVPINL
jgi:hypothetical protein